ncbi:MAG TPA: hypothetical protein DCW29_02895 [Janthinobacterium sp.]|nr:hypothetical protein [Janthinobacterium sp.]
METTHEGLPDKDDEAAAPPAAPARLRQALPPKGSCWYCEKPLDSVRRFCGKGCADSYDEEAEYSR